MTKLGIYNLALSALNVEPISEEDLEGTERHRDVATLDRWFMTALRKASREHRWPFLEVRLELGEDSGGGHGYRHSYALPAGTHSVTWAEGDRYRQIGMTLFSDGEAEAYGYEDSIIPLDDDGEYISGIPEDFYDLVAVALAYFTAYHFDPNLRSQLSEDYSSISLGMVSDLLRHGQRDMEGEDGI